MLGGIADAPCKPLRRTIIPDGRTFSSRTGRTIGLHIIEQSHDANDPKVRVASGGTGLEAYPTSPTTVSR